MNNYVINYFAIRSRKVSEEGSYHPLPSSATVQGEQIRSKMATPEATGQFVSSIQGARLAAAAMPQHERHAEISKLVMDAALRSSTVHHAFMQGRYMREWQVRNGQSDDHLK